MSAAKPSLENSKEIWLLLDSQIFGGIETHVLELAEGLREQCFSVRVVLLTQYHPVPAIIDKLEKNELCYSYLSDLHAEENPKLNTSLSPYQLLLLAAKEHCPRLIHAHGYKASLISKLAKIRGHLPSTRQVSTYHAGETPKGRVWLYDFIDRYSSFASNHSLAVSDKIRKKLPSRSTLLNNFISVPNVQPSIESNHFAFVGRLSNEKGPDRFIKLADSFPRLTFDIYGDGPDSDKLKQQSHQQANVILHGHQQNMAEIWKNVSVLIITSRFEGLPMAALEAMGRGIPVIALSVGNLPALISNKQNGFIVDSPNELPECINQWLEMDEEQQRKIRSNARETIKTHYSSQAVIPQVLTCYFS
ncbi:glycosyltransferase family 4 protein [Vibrio makurazakiensis]|uniref:glycosyltransferase family 4 protein n=1 Tax=Vibrio makurazakiensis TaxID=2910250 RepID=UPI003D140976